MTPTDVVTSPLADMVQWLLIIAGVGMGIGGAVFLVRAGWSLVCFFIGGGDLDAEARAAGYKDSADRARDHW